MYSNKTLIRKDTCVPMFTAALFTITKTREQPKCPLTDKWIKKMWCMHTVGYYSAIEKNEIMPFAATWMSLEMITLKKSERERQIPYVTYMWNLKYDTNERLWETKMTHRHKAKWIDKVLPYSTGTYIQYPVMNHNGKECEKECICMCNWVTLLYRIN